MKGKRVTELLNAFVYEEDTMINANNNNNRFDQSGASELR